MTAGRDGFYYRETISSTDRSQLSQTPPSQARHPAAPEERLDDVEISVLADSSSARLIQQLNEREKLPNPAWILYTIAVAVCIWGLTLVDGPNVADAYVLCLAGFVALIAAVAVHRTNREKRVTRLVYELDKAQTQHYSGVQAALGQLAQCQRIWRVKSRSFNADWKRNAGVSSLLEDAGNFYRMQLSRHSEAVAYLQRRGLHEPEVIESMRIGYAPGRCLRASLSQLGRTIPTLRQAGLVNDAGCDTYARRIVFPLEGNLYGRSIGNSAPHRFLPGGKGGLYAWEQVRGCEQIVLVEGLFDYAVLWQAGFRNLTCSLGNHLNAQQFQQLRPLLRRGCARR